MVHIFIIILGIVMNMKKGNKNNVWTANKDIYEEIKNGRKSGVKIIHRVSISTFEVEHDKILLDENGNYLSGSSKDKPWLMYKKIKDDNKVKSSVEDTLDELISNESKEEPFDNDFISDLSEKFKNWVEINKIKDHRFIE